MTENNINLDSIWSIMDTQTNNEIVVAEIQNKKGNYMFCIECNNELNVDRDICNECGFVNTNQKEYSSYSFEEAPVYTKTSPNTSYNNRLLKMQEWLMWTNDEKNEYKLNTYCTEFCQKLNINEKLISPVCNLVAQVMSAIKNSHDGPKRSRVKDGIIIVCIYYISKSVNNSYSYTELAKKIDLNMKYISKADKLIMELINNNKLQFSKEFVDNFLKTEQPMDYINKIIEKYQLTINPLIIQQLTILIDICEDNDILLDHMPLSIGVSCFYYILEMNKMDINLKIFSELYNLSMVTVIKTLNKLKQYDFSKYGITPIN